MRECYLDDSITWDPREKGILFTVGDIRVFLHTENVYVGQQLFINVPVHLASSCT
eukprot:m.275173 g.275173  ORF g.275173 m.275173 type:complete len:55 (+) comp40596_c0_seq4:132-296(+)